MNLKLFDQIFVNSSNNLAEFKRYNDKKFLSYFLKRDLNNHLIDKFFTFKNIQFLNSSMEFNFEYQKVLKNGYQKKINRKCRKNFLIISNKISLKIRTRLYNSEKLRFV